MARIITKNDQNIVSCLLAITTIFHNIYDCLCPCGLCLVRPEVYVQTAEFN